MFQLPLNAKTFDVPRAKRIDVKANKNSFSTSSNCKNTTYL